MSKYIKWELKDYFKRSYKTLIGIIIIFLLFLIMPSKGTGFFENLINFAFSLILIVTLCGAFIIGTKKVVNTFSRKTFLLESMISLSTKKLLISKYIIGLIINFLYTLIGTLGIFVALIKTNNIDEILEILKLGFINIDFISFIQVLSILLLVTLAWMSLIVLGFIMAKVLIPSKKGSTMLGIVLSIFIFYTCCYFLETLSEIEFISDHPVISIDMLCLLLSTISFFITSNLIEKKLEIYN